MNAVSSDFPPEQLASPHFDEALLALCSQLRDRAAEWQRLWNDCPEETDDGAADQAFEAYSDDVWPAIAKQGGDNPDPERDPIGQLTILPARTSAGRQARAAAVYAIERAERYLDGQREDLMDMMLLVVREAAGSELIAIGDHAPGATTASAT